MPQVPVSSLASSKRRGPRSRWRHSSGRRAATLHAAVVSQHRRHRAHRRGAWSSFCRRVHNEHQQWSMLREHVVRSLDLRLVVPLVAEHDDSHRILVPLWLAGSRGGAAPKCGLLLSASVRQPAAPSRAPGRPTPTPRPWLHLDRPRSSRRRYLGS